MGTIINNYNEFKLYEDKTIDIDPSMTIEDIQKLIEEQPKNLGGNTLNIIVAPGTYEVGTAGIVLQDFYGGGLLNLSGDVAANNMINGSIDSSNTILIYRCTSCDVYIQNISIHGYNGINSSHNNGMVYIGYCNINGFGDIGSGLFVSTSDKVRLSHSDVSNVHVGINTLYAEAVIGESLTSSLGGVRYAYQANVGSIRTVGTRLPYTVALSSLPNGGELK